MTTEVDTILKWRREGPASFAVDVLGVTPTSQQWEYSKALVEHHRVSIRSGHGTSKTASLAFTVLWFMSCYYPCKIPCSAPTKAQLVDVLFAEISKWLGEMKIHAPALAAEFESISGRVYLKSDPNESFAVARTARPENPSALQGFHSENLLFILDEAAGIPEGIFQVAEGALSTPGAFAVMCANPTTESGYFYESHHKMRASWRTLHWSCLDSRLVSKTYIEDMLKKYGEASPIYQTRVLGNFATAIDGVIPLSLCESAKIREVKTIESAPVIWSLDVARFGDDSSALAKRKGNVQLEPTKEWYGKDLMQTCGIIAAEYRDAREKPTIIHIDSIGLGAGVVDRLQELGYPVRGINVAEAASNNSKYMRLRDEMWFEGRAWLAALDCKLCDDDDLIAELTTAKYKIESSGKIKVEGKDEMKKRGVKSPNRADAWLMTFCSPPLHNFEEDYYVEPDENRSTWSGY